MSYSFSYSTIDDVYAIASGETGEERIKLFKFAEDLERGGIGWYDGEEFIYRGSPYGMEVVSMTDYQSEMGLDEEEEDE